MRVFTIYLATNNVNGKQYVGYDSAWPRRMRSHITSAKSNSPRAYKQRFHDALRKYGPENFTWTVLYQSWDQEHTLNVMEAHFIAEYRTFVGYEDCNGYNLTEGGEGQKNRPMSQETRDKKSASLTNKPTAMSNAVHTPIGIFPGLRMAAKACGIHYRTVEERIRRSTFTEWYYVDQCAPTIIIAAKGTAREIQTPHGTFQSIHQCSQALNIPLSTIQTRVESSTMLDWNYTGVVAKVGTKSISTPHGTFDSVVECARALGVSRSTIAARLRSAKQPDWYYV